ncbi:ATP-binding cassette domain-containing protein, partial [Serratia sp. ME43]|uniref:ATP-binding cassette domain-containing protein n=1 Tax=Serratia sp. ME43 TaxID=2744256 RepID=UPI0021035FAF
EQHYGPMSEIAPGWKLRVLLAQALFSDPEILLLDEPTNNLDSDHASSHSLPSRSRSRRWQRAARVSSWVTRIRVVSKSRLREN